MFPVQDEETETEKVKISPIKNGIGQVSVIIQFLGELNRISSES